jgi:hypothetical protein
VVINAPKCPSSPEWYGKDLDTIKRHAPLLVPGGMHSVETLEVYRDAQKMKKRSKRPTGEGEASPSKGQVVDLTGDGGPKSADGGAAEVPVTIIDSDGEDDLQVTHKEDSDKGEDPDHDYNKHATTFFRYHRIDEHRSRWPGPDTPGNRFDSARFMRDFGWPTGDVRAVFEREFSEGGKDLYRCANANHETGLAADLKEQGWRLADPSCNQLIKGLPLVEDVVFVRNKNYHPADNLAAGTCYWSALALHLYGDVRFWLRVKAEHLEHFARVLVNEDNPRHGLYKKLNSAWFQVKASPKVVSPRKGAGVRHGQLHLNLWQILNLPGVYTPMQILDVTADLYGLYLVVYSYRLPGDAAREKNVYKTAARGAYNARHLGLVFANGDHFQPIVPNEYLHWEFKYPRITQETASKYEYTRHEKSIRHPWRSEFRTDHGQKAPPIVDHGFDARCAAMAVGYAPPPEAEDDTVGSNKGGSNDGQGASTVKSSGSRSTGKSAYRQRDSLFSAASDDSTIVFHDDDDESDDGLVYVEAEREEPDIWPDDPPMDQLTGTRDTPKAPAQLGPGPSTTPPPGTAVDLSAWQSDYEDEEEEEEEEESDDNDDDDEDDETAAKVVEKSSAKATLRAAPAQRPSTHPPQSRVPRQETSMRKGTTSPAGNLRVQDSIDDLQRQVDGIEITNQLLSRENDDLKQRIRRLEEEVIPALKEEVTNEMGKLRREIEEQVKPAARKRSERIAKLHEQQEKAKEQADVTAIAQKEEVKTSTTATKRKASPKKAAPAARGRKRKVAESEYEEEEGADEEEEEDVADEEKKSSGRKKASPKKPAAKKRKTPDSEEEEDDADAEEAKEENNKGKKQAAAKKPAPAGKGKKRKTAEAEEEENEVEDVPDSPQPAKKRQRKATAGKENVPLKGAAAKKGKKK